MGFMERTSRSVPCVFCGDVGYDIRLHYPETEDVVHWCHKTQAEKGDIISVGGKQYICTATDHRPEGKGMGKFNLFKEYLSKEEWMAKQERINPDWKPSYPAGAGNRPRVIPKTVALKTPKPGELAEGEVKPLSNKQLDKIHRVLLSMLVLEKKHEADLLNEWKSPLHDVSHLIEDFKIRSLPPPDKSRFKSSYRYQNPLRKSIISKLYDTFGDLRGVPGLYMRTGTNWDNKPEKERWTFAFSREGVLYPCYDANGYIYRLRIKDEYPDREIKPGKQEPFKGMYGYFTHYYDFEGFLRCRFVPKDKSQKSIDVGLSEVYGKPRGKYKTLSSVNTELVYGDRIVNKLFCGCKSGSPYSLYTRPGDNFTVVFGPEGEKKAMVANAVKHVPGVSIPGVTNFSVIFVPDESGVSLIDYLISKGMKYFVIGYDADKDENEQVAESEQEFAQELKKRGVIPMVAAWRHDFDKGLDDILLKGLDVEIHPAKLPDVIS